MRGQKTMKLTRRAVNTVRVSALVVWDALAVATVVAGRARGVLGAKVDAGVDTFLVLALELQRALGVGETLVAPALLVGAADRVGRAVAGGGVPPGPAEGVLSALPVQAGVAALAVVAGLVVRALGVRPTAGYMINENNSVWRSGRRLARPKSLRSTQTKSPGRPGTGSDTKPLLQEQVARWLFTLHAAFLPQARVVHGSWHFSWMHARWSGHSGWVVHSGRGAESQLRVAREAGRQRNSGEWGRAGAGAGKVQV